MKNMEDKIIHTDGGLEGYRLIDGKPRGQGYAKVNLSKDDRTLFHMNTLDNTNQEAELFALFCAVCVALKTEIYTIYSDSEWAIKLVSGEYTSKDPRFKLLVASIKPIIKYYKIKIKWIAREQNLAT